MHHKLLNDIKEDKDYIIALRRYFHTYPELSMQEYQTSKKIYEELTKVNIEARIVDGLGVYAEINGQKDNNKTLLLRADIDALPIQEENDVPYKSQNNGIMHACGHDGHISGLIGAARVLNKNKDLFNGKIIFNFQPGEETGAGAKYMINKGCTNNATRAFGIHLEPTLQTGKILLMPLENNASVDQFKIIIHGKTSHITMPEKGIDACLIASLIVTNLQSLITKLIPQNESALIGIGKIQAGTAYNIIADKAIIEGTIRTFSQKNREILNNALKKLTENIADIFNANIEYLIKDNTAPLINDIDAINEVSIIAKEILGKDNVLDKRIPLLTGDDMAEYLLKIKGCYGYVGTNNPQKENTSLPLHNAKFDFDEDALEIITKLHVFYAIDYLKDIL